MQSKFENGKCGQCGGANLAHVAEWYSGEIPAGIEGEIACRDCFYWEKVLTTSAAKDVLDTPHWVVLEAGQGQYHSPAEREQMMSYRDPEAANYPRFGVE